MKTMHLIVSVFLGLMMCANYALAQENQVEKHKDEQTKARGKANAESDVAVFSFHTQADVASLDTEQILKDVAEKVAASKLSEKDQKSIIDAVKEALVKSKSVAATGSTRVLKGVGSTFLRSQTADNTLGENGEIVIKGPDGSEQRLKLSRMSSIPDVLRQRVLGLKKDGETDKFILGIALKTELTSFENDDSKAEESAKIIIDQVFEDSPAAAAGLMAGDVVVSVNDKPIASAPELIEIIQAVGKKDGSLSLAIQRDTAKMTKLVKPQKKADLATTALSESGVQWLPGNFPPSFVFDNKRSDEKLSEEIKEAKDEIKALHQELDEIKELIRSLKK